MRRFKIKTKTSKVEIAHNNFRNRKVKFFPLDKIKFISPFIEVLVV